MGRRRFRTRFNLAITRLAKTNRGLLVLLLAMCLCPGCRIGQLATDPAAIQPVEQEIGSHAEVDSRTLPGNAGKQSAPPNHPSQKVSLVGYEQSDELESSTDAESGGANPSGDAVEQADLVSSVAPELPASQSTQINAEGTDALSTLTLETVLASVADCYPELEIALGEIQSAQGKVISSRGAFDEILSAHSISQPLGFYQTYRNGVGLTRPRYNGGEYYGTYRIGDGNFEPWFGERETNEGGEFKAGFSIPLVKDRAIDARRARLFASEFQQEQLAENVEARLLQIQRRATQAYWDWVASGRAVEVQQRLLKLALARVEQISNRVSRGDLAEIARIDNDRFIAKRRNMLIKTQRLQQQAAIKLSLYYRDSQCCPLIPDQTQLPVNLPETNQILPAELNKKIAAALAIRPELLELNLAREAACVELQYAKNLTLPKLDLQGFAGQDVGGAASSTRDKTPFELQLGVVAEVPVQRREGLGKIQTAQGKLTQIDSKIRFTSDKIRAEIQDAASAVNAALQQILQSQTNLELTRRSLELGKLSFEAGDIDLIALNIYETAVADAELELIDAQFQYFYYRAAYEAAISGNAF